MEINYVKGSKENFNDFVKSIGLYDKVAILSHVDLDGLASALFLEKILEANGIKVDYLDFLDIKKDMVKEVSMKLKEAMITKVFFCDIGIDSIDFEGFVELNSEKDVFLIDHHPMNPEVKDFPNVIKTDSQDCSAMVIFEFGKNVIDSEAWEWLNCAAIFSDYSYKEEKNLHYLQEVYSEVTKENISTTTPGINGRKINSALIYYADNKRYVYDLVKERKMDEISKVHDIIENEINSLVENFSKEKEYYPEKNLYFYEVNSDFNVLSTIVSILSKMSPSESFVFMHRYKGQIKFSARNSNGVKDMGFLMKKCTEGLEGASGGGHAPAAAARIRLEDLEEFRKRLLE